MLEVLAGAPDTVQCIAKASYTMQITNKPGETRVFSLALQYQ